MRTGKFPGLWLKADLSLDSADAFIDGVPGTATPLGQKFVVLAVYSGRGKGWKVW